MAIGWIGAALLMALLSAGALARQPDAFDTCARQQDPALRLLCFDRAAAAREAADQAPPLARPKTDAPAPNPTAAAPATPPARSDIGRGTQPAHHTNREHREPSPSRPTPVVARVVRVIPREPFISAYVLDNGEVWEQTETSRFSAQPREEITIRPGVFGSFFLEDADGISVRVRRVK